MNTLQVGNILKKIIGDKNVMRLRFYRQYGRFPRFKRPGIIQEKILADVYSDDFIKFADYADKVKVRDYVKEKGLEDILREHYAVWNDVEDISIDALPDNFILKANNGCNGHIVCRDKRQFDLTAAKAALRKAVNDGLHHDERHYRHIKPLVFAEQLLDNGDGMPPVDYKFACLNGEVCDIFVVVGRGIDTRYCIFDSDWRLMPVLKQEYLPAKIPEKPANLAQMVETAKILSADFEFVRVDLYDFNGKIYFSELTFSPAGGLIHSGKLLDGAAIRNKTYWPSRPLK